MAKCPFCGFNNEDGALFCEQCKGDLANVPAAAPSDPIPMAAVVEETPMATPVEPEAVPMAQPAEEVVEATPVEVTPVEAAPVEAAPPPAAAAAVTAPPPAAPAAAGQTSVPPGSQPKLVVIRGQKRDVEFPIYPELNFIGRADEKPVDIDLENQEPPDRVYCSRQHAVIHYDDAQGLLTLEDLNSANGTFVNRERLNPGNKKQLFVNDVVQIGSVQMRLKI